MISKKIIVIGGIATLALLGILYYKKISIGAGVSNTISPKTGKMTSSIDKQSLDPQRGGTPARKAKVAAAKVHPFKEVSAGGRIFTITYEPDRNKHKPYYVSGNYFKTLAEAKQWVRSVQ